ncbi:MAG: tRNA (adenosine(37)-N6)-dimethylallyltransferase MiaA [Gemmiger sp.]
MSEPRVIAVGGPTASGKTALSVALAKTFDGEIINADSMQLYKGLDIGTAKPSPEEQQGIPHHLLDFLPPETAYSVADFTAAADPLIRDLTARGRPAPRRGRHGAVYHQSFERYGVCPGKDRPRHPRRITGAGGHRGGAALYAELQRIDPDYAAQVHPNNLPRVIRALELFEATGRRMSDQRREAGPPRHPTMRSASA